MSIYMTLTGNFSNWRLTLQILLVMTSGL